eukprot:TRINITY_DN15240_c0_g1_i1.p1 TRINITY_DN15240_c0_g1~~TRINITY_DN15240_c0_g1_i1.p1  ORF type:complete len:427 (-),score=114.84 TRINITY_DN15240_c0_g1_i1:45-1325(-)
MSETAQKGVFWTFVALDVLLASRVIYKVAEARWKGKYIAPHEEKHKPRRVWVDGVFDMMHFGHANMLRQARALGDYLVVGVNSDETVIKEKGTAPVMTDDERYISVAACKWADEVIPKTPYVMDAAYIEMIIEKYQIDVFVHGDDPCFDAQGNDVYGELKRQGKFQTVKRTEGVSSTELVGRMLLMTKDHHKEGTRKLSMSNSNAKEAASVEGFGQSPTPSPSAGPKVNDHTQTKVSTLTTSRRLRQFSPGRAPRPGEKIVYVDGSWDMGHHGHMEFFKAARAMGDFLLVGICADETVNQIKGANWPIMNIFERTLGVLSCRYVDEVVIDAPWAVTKDLINTMNISLVVSGTVSTMTSDQDAEEDDPYKIAKEMGIYRQIASPSAFTTQEMVQRIVVNKERYSQRYATKAKKEQEYNSNKKFVAEI